MRRNTLALVSAVVTLTLATPALAGIADSPLPVLDPNAKTNHLYSVPGVMNDAGTTLGTYFSCTSTSTAPQIVGVEIFAAAGGGPLNVASATALLVAPGASVTFGTVNPASLFADATLAPPMHKGSARILSTSKSLICTAFVADAVTGSPAAGWQLTIVAKTKQKAAN
jgi:hypothetical protein